MLFRSDVFQLEGAAVLDGGSHILGGDAAHGDLAVAGMRAQIHHRPASFHGGYTLLSPSLHSHCVLSYSGISLPEANLTHDEACDQLKGPWSSGLHRQGP